MSSSQTPAATRTVERFGSEISIAMGWPPTAGRILGTLMLHRDAMSMKELQETLDASAGAVSECARLLDECGVVQRVKMPSSRQIGYVYRQDAWLGCLQHEIDVVDRLLRLATSSRNEIECPDSFASARFEDMRTYYSLVSARLGAVHEELTTTMAERSGDPA